MNSRKSLSRRQFLKLGANTSLYSSAAYLSVIKGGWAAPNSTIEHLLVKQPAVNHQSQENQASQKKFISAASSNTGQHILSSFSLDGHLGFQYHLENRGHGFAHYPKQDISFAISRRPSNTLSIFNTQGKGISTEVSHSNRHFYGHAVCSKDGYLYTNENDFENGTGVIGVRQVHIEKKSPSTPASLKHIKEYSSYGIGPHDINLSNDEHYIIVANGGIKTHPKTGRKKLNLKNMESSLVFIHRDDGTLSRKATLPVSQRFNSIRHLAILPNNDVIIALQQQAHHSSEQTSSVLLARYDFNLDQLHTIDIPSKVLNQLHGYLGSIAVDKSYSFFATTSPRGGYILIYTINGKYLAHFKINDACGVYASEKSNVFIATNGKGEVYKIDIEKEVTIKKMASISTLRWDNHLSSF